MRICLSLRSTLNRCIPLGRYARRDKGTDSFRTGQSAPCKGTPPGRELLETTCVDVDAEGLYGICIDKNTEGRRRAIFIPGALPGAVLRVAVDPDSGDLGRNGRQKNKLTYGVIVEVLKDHSGKVEPQCRHFGECGGCSLQQMSYEAQLETKKSRIRNSFERIAKLPADHAEILGLQVKGSPSAYRYRNRVEFSVADGLFGKHRRGSRDLVEIERCHLQSQEADHCYGAMVEFFEGPNRRRIDAIEYVVIRTAHSGELLVNVATREREDVLVAALAEHLSQYCRSIRGVVNSVLVKGSSVGLRQVEEEHVAFGEGFLEERLGDLIFKVSANAFFQVNTPMTEALYRHVVEAAGIQPTDVVYDLCCGAGTIGLFLSKHVAPKALLGIELAETSVADAADNAKMNDVSMATFVQGDVGDLRRIVQRGGYAMPDVVIVDPARSGLSKRAVDSIVELGPRTLVYVSCDVSTQARDVKRLIDSERYRVASIAGFDLYPQTTHVESVCTLTRIS